MSNEEERKHKIYIQSVFQKNFYSSRIDQKTQEVADVKRELEVLEKQIQQLSQQPQQEQQRDTRPSTDSLQLYCSFINSLLPFFALMTKAGSFLGNIEKFYELQWKSVVPAEIHNCFTVMVHDLCAYIHVTSIILFHYSDSIAPAGPSRDGPTTSISQADDGQSDIEVIWKKLEELENKLNKLLSMYPKALKRSSDSTENIEENAMLTLNHGVRAARVQGNMEAAVESIQDLAKNAEQGIDAARQRGLFARRGRSKKARPPLDQRNIGVESTL